MKFIAPMILFVQMVTLSPSFPWFMDKGLEDRVNEMKSLFRGKKLVRLYSDYVDVQLKMRIGKSIDRMRGDKRNIYRISKRLEFKKHKDYLTASHNEIVSRFFHLMLNPPKKRKKRCLHLYLQAEHGDVFCRKVEGHRGCHSALVEWE